MARKIRSYESADLVVSYDVKRCIHAEECVHGLPKVFDPQRKPWIDPTQGPAADIVNVVERCPTGALQYRWQSGKPGEQAPPKNTVKVSADGPLYIAGKLEITMPDGEKLNETRAALCRCGHSKDKPFCDNSHVEAGFADAGAIAEIKPKPAEDDESLLISLAQNGPVLFRGPVEIHNENDEVFETGGGAFCRCGHSSTKPFCDGTHKNIGFEAE